MIDDFSFSPEQFSGVARVFPLPDLVLFPHVMQPLHIFEPRYREMVVDALQTDHLIAMGLLEPGWEADYEGRPPIAPIGCLGKIVSSRRLDDGCYNLMLLGVSRLRLVRELAPHHAYREAEVELLDDDDKAAAPDDEQLAMQQELLAAFMHVLPKLPLPGEDVEELLGSRITLGMLTDIVAYTLNLDVTVKRQLLGELRPERRAQIILANLSGAKSKHHLLWGDYPPKFSRN